eukprot:GFUD01034534.1.p1 GENE.GFUD01034534.1~~GFUD01034534.1.p1  ORF type:complete len:234 (+),score=28.53 GFUD01034534.1:72-773(+)
MSEQTEDIETVRQETVEDTLDTGSNKTKEKTINIMKLIFKLCNAIFISGTFIYFMSTEVYPLRVLEALTYQGLLLLSAYCVCALAEECYPQLKTLTTLMQNVSFPVALFISALSWVLKIPVDYGGLWTFKNHFFHTFNSLSCFVSMAFYKQVWNTKQCFIPLIYGLGYAAFAGTSQALGAEALYPFLDFKNEPKVAAVIIVIAIILIPTLHITLCMLSKYCFHRKKQQGEKQK